MSNKEFSQDQLFSPHVRSLPWTVANSASTQHAGRTVLSSGSATVTVSTTLVDSDSIILLGQQGLAGSGQAIEVKSISPSSHIVFGTVNNAAARS